MRHVEIGGLSMESSVERSAMTRSLAMSSSDTPPETCPRIGSLDTELRVRFIDVVSVPVRPQRSRAAVSTEVSLEPSHLRDGEEVNQLTHC